MKIDIGNIGLGIGGVALLTGIILRVGISYNQDPICQNGWNLLACTVASGESPITFNSLASPAGTASSASVILTPNPIGVEVLISIPDNSKIPYQEVRYLAYNLSNS